MKAIAVGPFTITQLSENEKVTVYDLTIQERNNYKEKSGEFEGQYGRTFIPAKLFADTPEKKRFVEETLIPLSADNQNQPIKVELRYKNNSYTKQGDSKPTYNDGYIVDQITPYL